ETLLDGVQNPDRQVPDVDELHTRVAWAGGRDGAAPGDPCQPPGQPPDVLVRAEDEPGAHQQRLVPEHPQGREFTPALHRRVVGLAVVGGAVDDLCLLPETVWFGEPVDGTAGDVDVVLDCSVQETRGV